MSDEKIKPKYYKVVGDYDVLDIIKALSEKSTLDGFTDHCRFHALKYLFRAGLKDDSLQDLKKAAEFLAIGVKHLEEKRAQGCKIKTIAKNRADDDGVNYDLTDEENDKVSDQIMNWRP